MPSLNPLSLAFPLPSPPLPLRLYDGVAAMEREGEGEGEREGRSEGVFLTAAPEQEFVLRRREGEGSSARGHVSESEVAVGFSFGVRHMWEAFTVSPAAPCSALCKAWSVPRIGLPPQGRCAVCRSAAQRRAPVPSWPQCMTAWLGDGTAGRRHGWETARLGDGMAGRQHGWETVAHSLPRWGHSPQNQCSFEVP